MKDELLKGLTEEQIAKFKACKTQEEVLSLAKSEGIELSDEQLESVSGGACTAPEIKCPKCGSKEVFAKLEYSYHSYVCTKCDFHWRSIDSEYFQ